MDKRYAFVTYVILCLAIIASISVVAVEGAYVEVVEVLWGTPSDPWIATPGDKDARLSITIQNMRIPDKLESDFVMCGITATLRGYPFKEYPFRSVTESDEAMSYYAGSLPFGSAITMQFRLNIDEHVEPGVYDAILAVNYYKCGTWDTPRYTISIPIKIKVWQLPALDVIDVSWESDGLKASAGPGSRGMSLAITLHNPSQNLMSDVVGRLMLSWPFTNATGGSEARAFISGTVQPNSPLTLRFNVNVAEDAVLGTYTALLQLEYYNHWGTKKTQVIQIPVVLEGKGELFIYMEHPTSSPGSTISPRVSLINNGTAPFSSLEIKFSPSTQQITVLSGEIFKTPYLPAGEKLELSPLLQVSPITSEGTYPISLTISYKDIKGNLYTETRNLIVTIIEKSTKGLAVWVEGNPLRIGMKNEALVKIQNLNDEPIPSLKASLDVSGLPISVLSNTTSEFFDNLNPGDVATIKFVLIVSPSAQETIYQAKLNVEYRNSYGMRKEETLPLSFIAKGTIDLTFKSLEISKERFSAGDTIDIVGEILNRGGTTAKVSDVSVFAGKPFVITSLSNYYIGDIDPYATVSFSVSLDVAKDASPGAYNISLVVTYQDSYGELHKITSPINIRVVEGQQLPVTTLITRPMTQQTSPLAGLGYILPIVFVVVIVVQAVLLIRYRKKLSMLKKGKDLEAS
ncbi:MAG: COG1361 S-layer family protein [Nitrososphaerota archaeon]